MKNNKGFSLVEVMTVVIILGILATLSIPYVIGYVRDAQNDRAKSVLFLIAQGVKSFRSDFSYLTISNTGPITHQNLSTSINANSCDTALENIQNNTVGYDFLIKCSFLQNLKYSSYRYNFYIGTGHTDCAICGSNRSPSTDLACMVGTEANGDYCTSYCAFIDQNNNLHEISGTCSD